MLRVLKYLVDQQVIEKNKVGYLRFKEQPLMHKGKLKKIKIKKIRKSKKVLKPKAVKLGDIKKDSVLRKITSKGYKDNPSTRLKFIKWKRKSNIAKWNNADLLGYYLCRFKKYYGDEDFELCLDKLERFELYIIRLFNFGRKAFPVGTNNYKKEELKNYLDWLFDDWLPSPDDNWLDGQVSFPITFDVKKGTLLKRYRDRNSKSKKKRKKGENKWSNKNAWQDYEEN